MSWSREPGDDERPLRVLTEHIDACARCQLTLEQISKSEKAHDEGAAGRGLLDDLRRPPPLDELDTEPESVRAITLAEAAANSSTVPRHEFRPPNLDDVEALARRGQYEIIEVLGTGGMGVVYKARHIKMGRLVAIKVLQPVKLQQADAVARFGREMKSIARLSHPNIVAAYDADEADGKQFLVMEFIDGVDLKSLVNKQGPLPVGQAVDYVIQAARGLHYAHEQGIVHRDIKPANLMLDRGGKVKVLDLGLASCDSHGELQNDLTDTGMIMGTVDYLAPEQAANTKEVDRRADIYSLGCSLYYLLTGQTLHKGDTAIQKVLAHREQPTPSLRTACPEVPAWLESVFAKMVAKQPDQRYATMAEVIVDLEHPTLVGRKRSARPGDASRALPRAPTWRTSWLLLTALVLIMASLSAALLPPLIRWWRTEGEADMPHLERDREGDSPTVPHLEETRLTRGTSPGQEWSGNALHLKFCWCPPGSFAMGSPFTEPGRAEFESPPADVVLTRGFWLGKFEVTQEEWTQIMGTNPSRFHGPPNLPVENVTWSEAVKFCEAFTVQERQRGALPADWEFRLPTEAQWEYACRAGTTTAYSFGPAPDRLGDYAWHGRNAEIRTHAAGGKKTNPWGLQDMHGNVWEWCRDWFQGKLSGGTDPEVAETSHARVMRGGGWNAAPELCRTAFRSGQEPEKAGHLLGFRVAAVQAADQRPVTGEALSPGRWYDLLAVVSADGNWVKSSEGLFQTPPVENRVIQVPVALANSYRLESSFTRRSGDRSVNYYFPVGERVGILYLDFDSVDSLVINGKEGSQSPVKSKPKSLLTGRRYGVAINVTLQKDEAAIKIDLDGDRHLEWSGAPTSLPADSTSGRFALGSRDGDTIFHELRVQLKEVDSK